MCKINELDSKGESFVLVTQISDEQYTMEFSAHLAKRHLNRNLNNRFPDVEVRKERGALSKTLKKIMYFCANKNDIRSCQYIIQMNEIFEQDKVKAWYRNSQKSTELQDWYTYAKQTFGQNLTPKKCNYTLFLNAYGNVDAYNGLPKGWHETSLTVTQLKKLEIPHYKACVGFNESYSHYNPILRNIIPDDFTDKENDFTKMQKKKKNEEDERIQKLELTKKLIAECLYSINKEAKRKRDIQSYARDAAYGFGAKYPSVHYNLHLARNEKEALYHLKDIALRKAIQKWGLPPDGYHEFGDMNRDMYTIESFSFHINEQKSEVCLGKIEDEIAAERKRSIRPERAVKILNRFISE